MTGYKGDTPQKKDRVRVAFDAEYAGPARDGFPARMIVLKDGRRTLMSIPDDASVEVLERAEQLCGATEGATGITCGLRRLHAAAVDHEGTHDPATADYDGIGYRLTVRWPWNEWDRDAKAVTGEEPLPDWEREILEQEAARKGREVSGAGVPFPADAPPLPKPLDRCTFDDCPGAPRCSSGSALWHDRTPECRPPKQEPRVFQSDGPEPPTGVTVLEDEGPDWGDMKYLLRTGDLWCWSPSPELVYPDHSSPVLWERAARQAAGRLREVV